MKTEDIKVPGKLSSTESELRASFLDKPDAITGGEKIKT